MNYAEIAEYWFPVVFALAMASLIVYAVMNTKWVAIKIKKDPRWKNRVAIVNFIFISFTVFATVIIGIAGALTQ